MTEKPLFKELEDNTEFWAKLSKLNGQGKLNEDRFLSLVREYVKEGAISKSASVVAPKIVSLGMTIEITGQAK